MEVQTFIKEMISISSKLCAYFFNESGSPLNFQEIIKIINDTKVLENAHKLREIIYIIGEISSEKNITPFCADKRDQVLTYLLDSIKSSFSSELKFFLKK